MLRLQILPIMENRTKFIKTSFKLTNFGKRNALLRLCQRSTVDINGMQLRGRRGVTIARDDSHGVAQGAIHYPSMPSVTHDGLGKDPQRPDPPLWRAAGGVCRRDAFA